VNGWRRTWTTWWLAGLAVAVLAAACAKKQPPVARPTGPPPGEVATGETTARRPAPPPEPVSEPTLPTPEPAVEESPALDGKTLDELNRDSPLQPVFFDFDSSEVSASGQAVLDANAEILKRHPAWVVTVEGHCDERGTAEYNLALGERRAIAARTYLVSLGIPAASLRTVSYGEEFPFDPGRTEEARARNRRAHFVITSK
jgi:peptidoglycan-associated lipoprotein